MSSWETIPWWKVDVTFLITIAFIYKKKLKSYFKSSNVITSCNLLMIIRLFCLYYLTWVQHSTPLSMVFWLIDSNLILVSMVLPCNGLRTYLKDRSTQVMINNVKSQQHIFNYSVPQGSVYTSCWWYQIPGDCEQALGVLTSCVYEINTWMCQNMLQLNQKKNKFTVIATPHTLSNLPEIHLNLGGVSTPTVSTTVKNLGVTSLMLLWICPVR